MAQYCNVYAELDDDYLNTKCINMSMSTRQESQFLLSGCLLITAKVYDCFFGINTSFFVWFSL